MKKQVLIILGLALLSFSCSTEEVIKSQESITSLEAQVSLSSSMSKLLKNDKFKDYLNNKNSQLNLKNATTVKAGNQGLMILSDGYNVGFGAIASDFSSFMVIGGTGTIEKLPNGKAKFSVHTNSPDAFTLDFSTWSGLSSDCVDAPRGSFNYSFISEYIVEVWEPEPGLIFTFYTPTGESSSATSANGHCRVSDAEAIIDWDTFEQIGCSEATIYKTISIKGNATKGFKISLE
ncbi:hypothetical protein V8G56_08155 [Gaetbulibacter aquiaggeris]|uniref:Lipoprotein n=1 Tax=Gaetbulibacter aquiaggeris TaxID=1735373 RepID=A0ABW7MQ26_9FLAO